MTNPQEWVWETFALYDSLYSFMPPFILHMDKKRQTLTVERSLFKQLIWIFFQIVNVYILWLGVSTYVIVKWVLYPNSVKSLQAITAVAILIVGIMTAYTSFVHYVYREDHVLGVNTLLRMHAKKIEELNGPKKVKKGKRKQKQSQPRDWKQEMFGKAMKGRLWVFFAIPLVIPVAVFEGVDPYKVVLHDLVPDFYMDKYPIHVTLCMFFTRCLICIVVCLEACRFLALFFLLFISGIIIYIDLLDKVINDKRMAQLTPNSFYEYKSCRILIRILNPVLCREICCLMFVGFAISVGTNVGAVQGYEILPWYMYSIFVMVAILTMVIINFTLPFGTDSHEMTAGALEKWRYEVKNSKLVHVKHVRKVLQSLRPISVFCGPFFKLQRETKSTYFDSIFSTSCDFNISVDLKELFQFKKTGI